MQGREGRDPKGKRENEHTQSARKRRNTPKGHEREGTHPKCKGEKEETQRARERMNTLKGQEREGRDPMGVEGHYCSK